MQQSVGMASVLWDAHSKIFIDDHDQGRTINSESDMALLVRLNAPCQKSIA